jgi:hypothetical protein
VPLPRKKCADIITLGFPLPNRCPERFTCKDLKLSFVSQLKSDFGAECMRFEADAAVFNLVRRVPRVALEVINLSDRKSASTASEGPFGP